MAGEQRRTAADLLGLPQERVMPASIEVEQIVLGALLMHNGVWPKVSSILTRDCFFEPLHQRIFDVIQSLLDQGQKASAITCRTYLPEQELIEGVTPGRYLARLSAEPVSPADVVGYVKLLHDLKIRRDTISIAQTALERAYAMQPGDTGKAIADEALEALAGLNVTPEAKTGYQNFHSASYEALMAAERSYKANGAVIGLSTGLARLDDAMGGLQSPDLIIIAGRPGIGKTSLVTNICFNVARHLYAKRKAGEKTGVVGFVSLEMSGAQLASRILAEEAGVPQWKTRRGLQTEDDMQRLITAQRDLDMLPLEIDGTGGQSIGALRTAARSLKKKHGLELLAVDYLQLLAGSAKRGDFNRVQELTEITSGLKALAKELDVPIIALSQLSRKVEERDDKRPMLSDLRESGSIEQDADVVAFVYREEYYLSKMKEPPVEKHEAHMAYQRKVAQAKGVAEVILGKNRHGPEGTVELGFHSKFMRFLNEPEPRVEIPEDMAAHTREKKPSLHKDSSTLFGKLRNLTAEGYGQTPTQDLLDEDRNLKRSAKIIPVETARDAFGRELYGPDYDTKLVEKEFRDRMKELARNKLALWTGTEGHAYVWLPEQS